MSAVTSMGATKQLQPTRKETPDPLRMSRDFDGRRLPEGLPKLCLRHADQTAEEPSDQDRQHDQLHGKAGAGRQEFRRDAHHEHDNRQGHDAKLGEHA